MITFSKRITNCDCIYVKVNKQNFIYITIGSRKERAYNFCVHIFIIMNFCVTKKNLTFYFSCTKNTLLNKTLQQCNVNGLAVR